MFLLLMNLLVLTATHLSLCKIIYWVVHLWRQMKKQRNCLNLISTDLWIYSMLLNYSN